MDELIALLVVAGSVGAIVMYSRYDEQRRREAARDRATGRLQHVRSGDYPSSCSWCKNTTVARKLLVFEHAASGWGAADLIARLRTCADVEVLELASGLTSDSPRWRRFCTERCTREFFAAAHVEVAETFVSCDYCSVRFPLAITCCPNCGAAKRAA